MKRDGEGETIARVVQAVWSQRRGGGTDMAMEEWTVLAAIVSHQGEEGGAWTVESAATGTAALPASRLQCDGRQLADLHAEVLAVRLLRRQLWGELVSGRYRLLAPLAPPNVDSSPLPQTQRVGLRPNVRLGLYISQAPCGAASVWGNDDQRSGARLVVAESAASSTSTKPGRGERARSMSCSDKLAIWISCGLQGAWLSTRIEPIPLSVLVVGDRFDADALRFALIGRLGSAAPKDSLQITAAQLSFSMSQKARTGADGGTAAYAAVADSVRPCPTSWLYSSDGTVEKLSGATGVRLGASLARRDRIPNSLIAPRVLAAFAGMDEAQYSFEHAADMKRRLAAVYLARKRAAIHVLGGESAWMGYRSSWKDDSDHLPPPPQQLEQQQPQHGNEKKRKRDETETGTTVK